MKQIVDKLNKIAKKIDESVEIPQTDLIIDSLDAITKAYGGTPNDSNLIVDKLDDIAGVAHSGITPSGNIAITENTAEGEPLNVSQYATATVNVSGGGDSDFTTAQITIISNTMVEAVKGFVVYDEEGFENIAFYGTLSTGTDELTVPLYKGTAIWETLPQQDQYITVSGNITKDSNDGVLIITGDGTITYSKLK